MSEPASGGSSESFFATVKVERIHRCSWPLRRAVAAALTEYIKVICNPHRLQSFLVHRCPAADEKKVPRTAPRAA